MAAFFDNLKPLKCDQGNYMIYKLLNARQRTAFGEMGIQFMARVEGLTKAQAFHLVFKLVELYEKTYPP